MDANGAQEKNDALVYTANASLQNESALSRDVESLHQHDRNPGRVQKSLQYLDGG